MILKESKQVFFYFMIFLYDFDGWGIYIYVQSEGVPTIAIFLRGTSFIHTENNLFYHSQNQITGSLLTRAFKGKLFNCLQTSRTMESPVDMSRLRGLS